MDNEFNYKFVDFSNQKGFFLKKSRALNFQTQGSMAALYKEREALRKLYHTEPVKLGPPEGFKGELIPSENKLYRAYEPRELRQTAGTSCKSMAMYFLWRDVVKSIVVRHPDAKAVITLSISKPGYGDPPGGRFNIMADDTRRPGKSVGSGFNMPWACSEWPGAKAAKLFFVAAWATYMAHEATELVSNAGGNQQHVWGDEYPDTNRVFNVHSTWDNPQSYEQKEMCTDHWIRMNACMTGRPSQGVTARGEPAGQVVLESILGAAKAKEVWEAGVKQGEVELEALQKELEAQCGI
jgi:hypothetical protein